MPSNHSYNNDKFKKLLQDKFNGEYQLIGEYKGYNIDTEFLHKKCNHIFIAKPSKLLDGHKKCSYCNNGKIQFENYIASLNNEYILKSEYVNDRTKIKIMHNSDKCNYYEWEVRPSRFKQLDLDKKCPKCNKINNKKKMFNESRIKVKTPEEFRKEIFNLEGNNYIALEDYNTNRFTKIKMKHNIASCGYEFYMRPNDFLNGHRCPKCAHKKSLKELELLKFIKSIYNGTIYQSNRDIVNSELDIVLPDLKIAFEFDGLFWHDNTHKDKNYHLNKTLECNKVNYRLIHIFEDEWDYKQNIVKSKITHILGLNNNSKIYARNCNIKIINSKDKGDFLERNHIQGNDKSNIRLGLYYKDKLVAVMTFCKPRKSLGHNKDSIYDYELSRYASDINYRVIGGFGKLFKYFKDNYEWKRVITYADIRWSINNNSVYKKCNFKLLHISKPNYFYIKDKKRVSRFNYRKQKLKELFPDVYNESLTELQIMDKIGINRIYDCGNLVYEYEKSKEN